LLFILLLLFCHYWFFQFDILHNYDLILNCLNFRTLYSRQHHLNVLFLINVFNGKINCHSIMNTVDIRVPARQIENFLHLAWAVHWDTVLQLGAPVLLMIYADFWTYLAKPSSPLRIISLHEKVSRYHHQQQLQHHHHRNRPTY
jgi:hypothetical protein